MHKAGKREQKHLCTQQVHPIFSAGVFLFDKKTITIMIFSLMPTFIYAYLMFFSYKLRKIRIVMYRLCKIKNNIYYHKMFMFTDNVICFINQY